MNILITGASGYIGPYLCRELRRHHNNNVTAIYNTHLPKCDDINFIQCNLTELDAITKIFEETKPQVVYHLASVTPTRIVTLSDDYVEFFNNKVTEHIAKLCSDFNALMIFTSTDLVYAEGDDLKEDGSRLNPLTVYAKSKLMGESAVWEYAAKYLIIRMSLVYGFSLSEYTSFFDYSYRILKEGQPIDAFIDQFRNPLYIEDAARILTELPKAYSGNDIINLCGNEYLSRFEMCILMAKVFGFDKNLVKMSRSSELEGYVSVKKLHLNSTKLKNLGFKTNSFEDNLRKSIKHIH